MSTRKLTTTSYAILGLLAVRSWSAYDLAQQMQRSLGYVWPRAASAIYEEPKNLVAHGLARARDEPGERRSRAVYSITPEGRSALAAWLAGPSSPPQFESEALVRISFPEAGSREDVLRTLAELAQQAAELESRVREQARGYLDGSGGPFPERLHVIALDARFVADFASSLGRWADWAGAEVARWDGVGPRPRPATCTMEALAAVAGGTHGVRDAFDAELDRVAELTVDAYAEFAPILGPGAWRAYRRDLASVRERERTGARTLVAHEEGRLLGSVSYFPPAVDGGPLLPAGSASIRALAVAPDARRRGTGRELLRAALDRAAADGAPRLAFFTAPEMAAAVALYRAEGFDELGERRGPLGRTFLVFSRAL